MDNSDLESKPYHRLTKEEINELIDEIYKIQSSMVNVFKYTEDGYEMWSLPDRIKIYKYSEVFSRRSKNSQPEYISQFFEIIKYELKK